MLREDLTELLGRIPEVDHPKLNLILRSGPMLCIDTVIRLEPTYIVLRGREGGQVEDERGFFVPYDEIVYMRLEKPCMMSELTGLFGTEKTKVPQPMAPGASPMSAITPSPAATPAPSAPAMTPAEIARQNLLQRIKAAKSLAVSNGR